MSRLELRVKSMNLLWSWVWEIFDTGESVFGFFEWDTLNRHQSLLLVIVESGVGLGNFRVKSLNLLWFGISGGFLGGGFFGFWLSWDGHQSCLLVIVESGMSLGDLRVKSLNLFWLGIGNGFLGGGGFWLSWDWDQGLLLIVIESGMGLGDFWVKSLNLFWLGIGGSFLSGGCFLGGFWLSWDWDQGLLQFVSVHAGSELNKSVVVLNKVEFISFHSDILTKVFVSVHSSGESLLDHTGGSWMGRDSKWWLIEIWRSISLNWGEKGSNNEDGCFHVYYLVKYYDYIMLVD